MKFLKASIGAIKMKRKQLLGLNASVDAHRSCGCFRVVDTAFQKYRSSSYAVAVLSQAEDDEILIYLLQLVQALWYEPSDGIRSCLDYIYMA